MLAVFEAIGGQLYLVAGVAVLVGNLGRQRRAKAALDADETEAADPGRAGPSA
jgi:hypothetical protein